MNFEIVFTLIIKQTFHEFDHGTIDVIFHIARARIIGYINIQILATYNNRQFNKEAKQIELCMIHSLIIYSLILLVTVCVYGIKCLSQNRRPEGLIVS